MTEIVLRDIDPVLADRIRRIADARRWDLPRTLQYLLEQGLYAVEADMNVRFSDTDTDALREAIAALEGVPNDPGFSLIGRVDRPEGLDAPKVDMSFAVSEFMERKDKLP
ncbi:hypothetical protein GCM10027430_00040 [Lysobacter tyrosinilyticus]